MPPPRRRPTAAQMYENEIERLTAANAELLTELREARDDVESWATYATDYFRDKHDLAGDIARIDVVIAKHTSEEQADG